MLLYTSIRYIHDIRCLCYQHDKSPRRHNNNIRSSGWQKTKRSPMAELVNKPLHIIWQGRAIEKTVHGLNEWFSSCGALRDVSLIHTGMRSLINILRRSIRATLRFFFPLNYENKVVNKTTWSRAPLTSMCSWLCGTGMNWASLLPSHMVMSRFMLTAKGSKPSCRPQMVKYFRVLTSLPKFILPTWQTPRLHTGTNPFKVKITIL